MNNSKVDVSSVASLCPTFPKGLPFGRDDRLTLLAEQAFSDQGGVFGRASGWNWVDWPA